MTALAGGICLDEIADCLNTLNMPSLMCTARGKASQEQHTKVQGHSRVEIRFSKE